MPTKKPRMPLGLRAHERDRFVVLERRRSFLQDRADGNTANPHILSELSAITWAMGMVVEALDARGRMFRKLSHLATVRRRCSA